MGLISRDQHQRGSELLEFTLVVLALLACLAVVIDIAWAIFAKSTLQRAVRVGVTTGITLTASQVSTGACLTDTVKSTVQQNALGLLSSSAGLSSIKVNYFLPPAPSSTGPVTDVSSQTNGNAPGNIMQVSVQNFSLLLLLPVMISWQTAANNRPLGLSVYSAGLIEPSQNLPCIGSAP